MTQFSLVRFEVKTAEAGANGGPLTAGAMMTYLRALLVAAGWRAEGPVEQIVEGVWQCALDRHGTRFVLAGELPEPEAGLADEWCAAVISVGPESRRGFVDRLLGRNKPDPLAEAEAQKAVLAILGHTPGIRNLLVEETR
ncbi:hypothetical protein [Pararhodobacter aggregans]|uniref:hypothetical protein n=1 Tax=Pararhodobacter aggregans TaxID=404875 RepID=UPI003A904785